MSIEYKDNDETRRAERKQSGAWEQLDSRWRRECNECGGMGHTIGFLGHLRKRHPCESCAGV